MIFCCFEWYYLELFDFDVITEAVNNTLSFINVFTFIGNNVNYCHPPKIASLLWLQINSFSQNLNWKIIEFQKSRIENRPNKIFFFVIFAIRSQLKSWIIIFTFYIILLLFFWYPRFLLIHVVQNDRLLEFLAWNKKMACSFANLIVAVQSYHHQHRAKILI